MSEVERINEARRQAIAERGDRRPPVYKTKEGLQQAWYEVGRKVDAKIGPLFLRQPETELQIEPYEPYREQFFSCRVLPARQGGRIAPRAPSISAGGTRLNAN